MKSFLQYVAEDLVAKHGTDLSRMAVVFPNKRAALFMNEHLARQADHPIWSPAYMTISDLFRQLSDRQVADHIKLVCDLHKCFAEQTGTDETLDHFYGWGELLLADFDDLDKNMADADRVLANLRDHHELDDVSYLSEEQKAAIKRFFSNFSDDHNSELKQRFLRLWSRMADIYHAFNERLAAQSLAYEGALYREVAETLDVEKAPLNYDTYVFVGFNMVQRAEQRLFTLLKEQGRALFYWDFDKYYMNGTNEAGHYIAQYKDAFANELDQERADIYDCFSQKPKDITYISAPTENIQARYISSWLRQNGRIADGRRTAIVLCDEHLLQTVVHCLPDEVGKVNITTGYPLIQSPAASLVSALIGLQTNGYSAARQRFRLHHVNIVLRHPYVAFLSEEAGNLRKRLNDEKAYYPTQEQLSADEGTALLFTPAEGNSKLLTWLCDIMQLVACRATTTDPLFQESVFRTYTLLNRLAGLVESNDLAVDIVTLERLIGQLIAATSVPFHGEPAEGLQVMGVLETRNIDFDHVLLLSCNEGNMPKGVSDTSFIPYSIRKAYGLTTIDHKVSIYSYYFHRLLSRAKDVTIVYNNATTDGQRGEMSRFMLQLMVESPHPIAFKTLQAGQRFTPFRPKAIAKTVPVMDALLRRFSTAHKQSDLPLLTPTAINRYMRCQLMFYYNYVCDIREPEDNDEDQIDNRIFGNIFHEAAHRLYEQLMSRSRHIVASDIERLLRSRVEIERAVDEAFRTELFRLRSTGNGMHMELNGLQLINREVIIHYVRQLLQIDRRLAPFTIEGLECDVTSQLKIRNKLWEMTTTIGGRIDRLDRVAEADGEHIRVIDYKTGSSRLRPLANVEAVFMPESLANHSDYYLQTLLYSSLVSTSTSHNPSGLPVSPALLFIQHAAADDYDPVLFFGKERIASVANYREEFGKLLRKTVNDMFDPDQDFTPTADRQRCQNCPYRLLCSAEG